MKRILHCAIILLVGASVGACQKSSGEATPAPAASAAPVPDEQLMTPADFEDRVATEITPENAEQELDKLEKEIAE
jgi:uncharacterized lipoprotein YbaY